jgi:hypothetical protein
MAELSEMSIDELQSLGVEAKQKAQELRYAIKGEIQKRNAEKVVIDKHDISKMSDAEVEIIEAHIAKRKANSGNIVCTPETCVIDLKGQKLG